MPWLIHMDWESDLNCTQVKGGRRELEWGNGGRVLERRRKLCQLRCWQRGPEETGYSCDTTIGTFLPLSFSLTFFGISQPHQLFVPLKNNLMVPSAKRREGIIKPTSPGQSFSHLTTFLWAQLFLPPPRTVPASHLQAISVGE